MSGWRARFDRFVERKTAAATAAVLSPFVTEYDRADPTFTPIGNAWTRGLFDGPFYLSAPAPDGVPAASLVFVRSSDGNTAAKDPSTLGGGEADKHLIYEGLSRAGADAVLSGAETIRGGDVVLSVWHPELIHLRDALGLPRHPVQIVATVRGLNLEGGLMFNLPELRVIVLTVQGCERVMVEGLRRRPWIETVVMKRPDDLVAAFRTLGAHGINRISAIGGRTVARALIDAGLIKDLYLTTSPKTGGEPDTPLYRQPLEAFPIGRKHGTGLDAGVVFDHQALNLFA
jgi:5-amino-6-(5-phosphoribosylamino)uracil reductase